MLDKIFDRGVGAYRTNPASVRPKVKSAEQWAMSRVYAFVGKACEATQTGKAKINQDQDLFKKIKQSIKC